MAGSSADRMNDVPGSEINWQETAHWLNSATTNANQTAEDVAKFISQIETVGKEVGNHIETLPKDTNTDIKSKMQDIVDSLDEVISSATASDGIKDRCEKLCQAWLDFKRFFTGVMKRSECLTTHDIDVTMEKLNHLFSLCSKCSEANMVVDERLKFAVTKCSDVSKEFADKAQKAKEKESVANATAPIASSVATSVANVHTTGTGATVAKLLVGFGATAYAAWELWSAHGFGKLARELSSAHGRMETTHRELKALSDLIDKIKLQTRSFMESIELGVASQRKYKNTLEESNRRMAEMAEESNRRMAEMVEEIKQLRAAQGRTGTDDNQ